MTNGYLMKIGILVGLCAAGCSSSSSGNSGTTGQIIALKTRAEVKDDLTQAKTNALGWSITISEAYLSVGPLYYFAGDPVLSQRHMEKGMLRYAWATVSDWLVRPAHAHPGHYIAGAAMGQMLTPTTLDLLGGSVSLADGDGVTGSTNSA
jgi:hypothetical protein